MKARPRSVERSVAEALTQKFTTWGLSPVERIPILGREGPDISINELGLVIDVKSRNECPKSLFFPAACPFTFDEFLGVPLRYLETIASSQIGALHFKSDLVTRYWLHMDKWTKKYRPDGISTIILHRPTEPIGACVVVIHLLDLKRIIEQWNKLNLKLS